MGRLKNNVLHIFLEKKQKMSMILSIFLVLITEIIISLDSVRLPESRLLGVAHLVHGVPAVGAVRPALAAEPGRVGAARAALCDDE